MKRETINATPSWSAVLPMLLAAYSDGSVEGIDIAQQELERMAKLADHMKTIDMFSSWSGVLPMLLDAYSDGSVESIDIAQQELERMAKLADQWVDYSKSLEP